mmetsp:Transcript_87068/g.247012  ORF Transcript_87068/g.247012 Transcript_87068/m.247012 type:complete len:238 (+) Transcript_87068:38-751(+)
MAAVVEPAASGSSGMPIKLDVVHVGLGMTFTELPFTEDTTIDAFKEALYPRTGTEPANMALSLPDGTAIEGDGAQTLGMCGLGLGATVVHVTDTNEDSISNNLLNAAEEVPKVEGKSDAGFAAFRKASAKPRAAKPAPTDDTERVEAEAFEVGQRVTTAKGASATVRFIGQVEPLPKGWWVGIELDEPTGKNDGEVKGVRLVSFGGGRRCHIQRQGPRAEIAVASAKATTTATASAT